MFPEQLQGLMGCEHLEQKCIVMREKGYLFRGNNFFGWAAQIEKIGQYEICGR